MIWCSTKFYCNLLFSTKKEYSPCNHKWSKFICIYICYLFSNQQPTINSCRSFNIRRGFCFSHSHQATGCCTQGSVAENPQLLSHAQQDHLCSPYLRTHFCPKCIPGQSKMRTGWMYVPVPLTSFQPCQ